MKNYSITREKAAIELGVSTRTVDRYVKSGKLSYKKIANKVLLAKDEIEALKSEFSTLHNQVTSELIHEIPAVSSAQSMAVRADIDQAIDEKIDKFFLIFKEKDKMIEEKNKIIFMLQQRIGELETKIQTMIALPDYNREKQEAIIEKQKLEERISKLKEAVRTEKVKNFIIMVFSFVFIGIAIFLLMKYKIIS
jgi:hypothetical protein